MARMLSEHLDDKCDSQRAGKGRKFDEKAFERGGDKKEDVGQLEQYQRFKQPPVLGSSNFRNVSRERLN